MASLVPNAAERIRKLELRAAFLEARNLKLDERVASLVKERDFLLRNNMELNRIVREKENTAPSQPSMNNRIGKK
jgi:hypothetical protein